jgi:hypothetical protein
MTAAAAPLPHNCSCRSNTPRPPPAPPHARTCPNEALQQLIVRSVRVLLHPSNNGLGGSACLRSAGAWLRRTPRCRRDASRRGYFFWGGHSSRVSRCGLASRLRRGCSISWAGRCRLLTRSRGGTGCILAVHGGGGPRCGSHLHVAVVRDGCFLALNCSRRLHPRALLLLGSRSAAGCSVRRVRCSCCRAAGRHARGSCRLVRFLNDSR